MEDGERRDAAENSVDVVLHAAGLDLAQFAARFERAFCDHVDRAVAQTILDRLEASDASLRAAQLRVLGGAMARVPTGSYNVQEAFGWIVTPSLDRGTFCVLDRQGRLTRRVQVSPSSHDACFMMTV